jgi:hypothetical protein
MLDFSLLPPFSSLPPVCPRCAPDGITRLATRFTKSPGHVAPGNFYGEAGTVEWANLPHDFAETLELVFVGITIIISLAIMVAFGAWWQR